MDDAELERIEVEVETEEEIKDLKKNGFLIKLPTVTQRKKIYDVICDLYAKDADVDLEEILEERHPELIDPVYFQNKKLFNDAESIMRSTWGSDGADCDQYLDPKGREKITLRDVLKKPTMAELCAALDKARQSGKINGSWQMRNQLISIYLAEANRELIKQTNKAYDYFSLGSPPGKKGSAGCLSVMFLWVVVGIMCHLITRS